MVLAAAFALFFAMPASGAIAQSEERFDYIIKSAEADGGHVGTAEYDRVLESGAVWLDGDRVGYRVVYSFLDCNPANPTLNLRAAAHGYNTTVKTQILDRFMDEGSRHWDGTIEPDGDIPARQSDAPRPASHGSGFPTSVPVITVSNAAGDVCEVRDYGKVVDPSPNLTWAVVQDTPTEVIIGWYLDGLPAVEFYYTIIGGTYTLDVAS
jgi:hypothetical protein